MINEMEMDELRIQAKNIIIEVRLEFEEMKKEGRNATRETQTATPEAARLETRPEQRPLQEVAGGAA
jgi:hypothetical protein